MEDLLAKSATLVAHSGELPGELRKTLTWDHDIEMARQLDVARDVGMKFNFATP